MFTRLDGDGVVTVKKLVRSLDHIDVVCRCYVIKTEWNDLNIIKQITEKSISENILNEVQIRKFRFDLGIIISSNWKICYIKI